MRVQRKIALMLAAAIALSGCTKAIEVQEPASLEAWEYRFEPGDTLRVTVTDPLTGELRIHEGRFRSATREALILHNAEIPLPDISSVQKIVPTRIVERSISFVLGWAVIVMIADWAIDEVED